MHTKDEPRVAFAAKTVSIVVPTFRRPDTLVGCLRALHAQTQPPLEVLVCYRRSDEMTAEALESLSPSESNLVRRIVVGDGDNLAVSLNAGIAASRGELVALTDDDAEASADWIERLSASFTDERIAGVGGRDLQEGKTQTADDVGRVQWFGRRIANHDIGRGAPRDIDVLKGVNCCFRRRLLATPAIPTLYRGKGNVAHWELAMCLPLVRNGYRLVYDPSITVLHHIAPRKDGDINQRGGFEPKSLADFVHNETLALMEHLPPVGRVAFLIWSSLIGTHFTPGIASAVRNLAKGHAPSIAWGRLVATQRGRLQGLATWRRGRRSTKLTAPHTHQAEAAP